MSIRAVLNFISCGRCFGDQHDIDNEFNSTNAPSSVVSEQPESMNKSGSNTDLSKIDDSKNTSSSSQRNEIIETFITIIQTANDDNDSQTLTHYIQALDGVQKSSVEIASNETSTIDDLNTFSQNILESNGLDTQGAIIGLALLSNPAFLNSANRAQLVEKFQAINLSTIDDPIAKQAVATTQAIINLAPKLGQDSDASNITAHTDEQLAAQAASQHSSPDSDRGFMHIAFAASAFKTESAQQHSTPVKPGIAPFSMPESPQSDYSADQSGTHSDQTDASYSDPHAATTNSSNEFSDADQIPIPWHGGKITEATQAVIASLQNNADYQTATTSNDPARLLALANQYVTLISEGNRSDENFVMLATILLNEKCPNDGSLFISSSNAIHKSQPSNARQYAIDAWIGKFSEQIAEADSSGDY